jgi:hypothetical protein
MPGFRTTSAEDLIVYTLGMTAGGRLILVPIDFERRAWVSTVMSRKSMVGYLGAWLPDGFY